MSEEQREFAAKHHDLIYAFLYEQQRAVEEYYDIVAFGFLKAVMRYQSESHLQNYSFTTIAWQAMKQSIASYQRTKIRCLKAEQQYCSEVSATLTDSFDEMEAVLLLQELIAHIDPHQYQIAKMRLQGYSIAETARVQRTSPKRISRLLKQMHDIYKK